MERRRSIRGREREPWDALGLLNFGMFLLLVGILFASTPGLQQRFIEFFQSIALVEVSPNVMLPMPITNHPILYSSLLQFCLVFGVWHFILLGGRYFIRDSIKRKTDTVSSIVFWFGMASIFYLLLNGMVFWNVYVLFIILIGASIMISAIAAYFTRSSEKTKYSGEYIPPQQGSSGS